LFAGRQKPHVPDNPSPPRAVALQTLRRTAILVLAALVLVVGITLGSSRSAARVGGAGGPVAIPDLTGDLFVIVSAFLVVAVAGLVYILWGGIRLHRRGPELVRELPPVPWTAHLVGGLLAASLLGGIIAALVLAARNRGNSGTESLPPPGPTVSVPDSDFASSYGTPSFTVHWWILLGVAAILAGSGAWLYVRHRRRIQGRQTGEWLQDRAQARSLRRPLEKVVRISLEEIARDADPRRAIIRAYLRMSQLLAEHGLSRQPHEAPLEYLERALREVPLSRAAAERLTDLFLRARFRPHPVDSLLKAEAVAALTAVENELQAAEAP